MILPILFVLFSAIACGDAELTREQTAFRDYMSKMQGGDSLGLLDQGDILREEINEAVEKWLDDRTNPELVTILDGLIREVDRHVEKLGDIGITGELRSIHNKHINGWREWDLAIRDLRLYLFDPTNLSLLSSYHRGIFDGEARMRDYTFEIENYRSVIE
ncbi:MAG: hypothetical protein BZY81_04200 [SAR202 cluster bacterium Io17-Chloro-G4]|nr:MAG: hypothetical protein BZY81_04200 [SAR202 cluster bacterium Io17-Chloro-G4]